jgi:maltooligosyltrehalose trehalohydrolase
MAAKSKGIQVWAPRAARVEVVLLPSGERVRCEKLPRGLFRAEDVRLVAGQKYALALDGGKLVPDPESADQPEGVDGPSRVVDFASFVWTDKKFKPTPLAQAILYELHVGTFTPEGTFDAIIPYLPRLHELGITHVELMPVAHFPGRRGWGYDGVCLFAPQSTYGGPSGLARLVDACHAEGLGVILDVVYNHLGPSGNYLGLFGPYFTDRYTTPWGDAFNYDGSESDEVRRFVCDNAKHWIENYHIDGLRLDAVQAIFDQSPRHLLAQLSEEVSALAERLGKDVILIGESDLNAPRFVLPRKEGGYGLDAMWSDDFHHALHAALTRERAGYYEDFGALGGLAEALRHGFAFRGQYSRYRKRAHGAAPRGIRGEQLVVYCQNHDQVGNRPRGERLAALLTPSELKLAAALTLLSPFTPLLFMGEEWGALTPFPFFVDHEALELRAAVRDGRVREFREFGWSQVPVPDPSDAQTFEAAKLDWAERETPAGQELLRFYSELLLLRRAHPSLARVDLNEVRVEFDEKERWLILWRGSLGVVTNFGASGVEISLPAHRVVVGADAIRSSSDRRVELEARSVAVVELANA